MKKIIGRIQYSESIMQAVSEFHSKLDSTI